MPTLVTPTATVRASYLDGERADSAEQGSAADWLATAEADFASFVAARREVRPMWDVPTTELWYVDGTTYLGTLVIRHRLTPKLRHDGGHIGYNVVPAHRRKGHATAMLAEACRRCRALGLTELLLTCEPGNLGSRRVIEANGGRLEPTEPGSAGVRRYWIALEAGSRT